jgi:osmotically inducible protein OsmC
MVAIRTARTAWNGPLLTGAGQVELSSSNTGTFPVTWAKRTAEVAEGTTSPEELIAAAHSSCYSMELSGQIAAAGGTPVALHTTADVSFEPDPAGGWRISKIALTVRGEVEGMDAAGFLQAAETASKTCPVSKALTGTEITLDAALD